MAKVEKHTSIEQLVKWTLMEQLGVDEVEITPEASFLNDLGCDSLDSIELVMAFEEKLGIEIPDEDLDQLTTVEKLTEYLKAQV